MGSLGCHLGRRPSSSTVLSVAGRSLLGEPLRAPSSPLLCHGACAGYIPPLSRPQSPHPAAICGPASRSSSADARGTPRQLPCERRPCHGSAGPGSGLPHVSWPTPSDSYFWPVIDAADRQPEGFVEVGCTACMYGSASRGGTRFRIYGDVSLDGLAKTCKRGPRGWSCGATSHACPALRLFRACGWVSRTLLF